MDKNFAIDVSGCSQEQIKEMADWLCERFDIKIQSTQDALYNQGSQDNHILLDEDYSLYVSYLDTSFWPDKDFFTYNEALEIMKQDKNEYKEQNARKADIAMGNAIALMDKAGHDIRSIDSTLVDHIQTGLEDTQPHLSSKITVKSGSTENEIVDLMVRLNNSIHENNLILRKIKYSDSAFNKWDTADLPNCTSGGFTGSGEESNQTPQAWQLLEAGVKHMIDRASERDSDDGERSMLSTVKAFNAMYGTELTEEQGWMFMVFLKASRAKGGAFRQDDYEDGAAYFALAGESAAKERK